MNAVHYVYAYFNRLIGEFQMPITTEVPPDSFALAVRRSILMKPQEALKQNMNECRLFHIGSFDFQNGILIPIGKPVEILDCLEILAPFIPKTAPVEEKAPNEEGDPNHA